MTRPSYVLAHSPLTGPAVWGQLPGLLGERGHDVVEIDVRDDDQSPFAGRYVAQAAAQIVAAGPQAPTILVAHSGAGPLLPAIARALPAADELLRSSVDSRKNDPPAALRAYIFMDAVLPRPGQPSRLDMLREEDERFAAEFADALLAGDRFPTWTVHDLADVVPSVEDRIVLVDSLRPRTYDFFTEPLPSLGDWPDAPAGYLRTSAAYDHWLRVAEDLGWPVSRLDLGHFPALADPRVTCDALLQLSAAL